MSANLKLYWNGVLSITADAAGSNVTVEDNAFVNGKPALVVRVSGPAESEKAYTYERAKVSWKIQFVGSDRNDSFANHTSVLCTADGKGGDDVLEGGVADDTLAGGFGDDTLVGGNGSDTIFGDYKDVSWRDGNDKLWGGVGNDYLWGGAGADELRGEGNADYLYGGDGRDYVSGGSGNDWLYGEINDFDGSYTYFDSESDWLCGDAGNDHLYGGSGDDRLYGDRESDDGLGGTDMLYGGVGSDLLRGGAGNDELYGGEDPDWLCGESGEDGLYGDGGDDQLFGDFEGTTQVGSADYLSGGAGHDCLRGGRGEDWLFGDGEIPTEFDGADFLYGGAGRDYLRGGGWNDELHGGEDPDWLCGESGDDQLHGDGGDDRLYGDGEVPGQFDGRDQLYGDAGNDILFGGGRADFLAGGPGVDTLRGGAGSDGLLGGIDGNETDYLYGEVGDDRFLTRSHEDHHMDGASNDVHIRLTDGSSAWTEREVQNVDEALAQLQATAGNTKILKDPICEGDPLNFVKEDAAYQFIGLNVLYETKYLWGAVTDHWRRIHIRDWDETNASENRSFRGTVIHEVVHSWNRDEAAEGHPAGESYWSTFKDLSSRSQADNDYACGYGKSNVKEDWATVCELYFGYRDVVSPSDVLLQKLAVMNNFLRGFA